ncbi:hypothetical protein KGQ71_00590 [Patescibacteria group bacterium]|nr:hypothetical protein [Patescibacteria group bacterium]
MECLHPHHSSARFRSLRRSHDFLCRRFPAYHRWHHHPHHQRVHLIVLATYTLAVVVLVSGVLLGGRISRASSSAITLTGSASVSNTGASLTFTPASYNSNVTIDNYTRQLSGYAWSDDLGWIYFGGGNSNPAGPVLADKTGKLSGQALALNGGALDFNASPTGANVSIDSNGNFSGYAWSTDLGWVNFSGVSAAGYHPDLLPPDNPATVSALNAAGGSVSLTSGSWYNYPAPAFSWSVPADYADTITPSGIAGYYVYFGTDNTADPFTAGSYQTGLSYTAGSLTGGSTYYLRLSTLDNAGNRQTAVTLFTYKYDTAAPSAPTLLTVSPSGYSATNNFTFLWATSGSSAASDSGTPTVGSGVAGYQYKTGASSGAYSGWSATVTNGSVTLSQAAYQEGANTFYLRSVDNAGNFSDPISTTFYYAGTAPGAPQNLKATPTTSENQPAASNSFAFSWDLPATYNGGVKQSGLTHFLHFPYHSAT